MDDLDRGRNGSEHLLMAMAKTYPVTDRDLTPPGCWYNLVDGAWVSDELGSLLVDTPGRPSSPSVLD